MRVNPNPMPDLMAALNQTELEEQEASLQLSTGLSVNEPSDNPTAAALLVENNDQATFTAGYLQSISAVQGQLSTANSTFSSMQTRCNRPQPRRRGRWRHAFEQRPGGHRQSTARHSKPACVDGQHVVSGPLPIRRTATSTPPYVADSTSPSGVDYVGNNDVNRVSIGTGYAIAVNMPGSQLFSASGNDVFLAVNNLIQAVQSNTGIESAVTALVQPRIIFRHRRVLCNALSQATSQTNYLNAAKLQLSQQQTALGGANLAVAATNLSQAQTITRPRWPPSAKCRRTISLIT